MSSIPLDHKARVTRRYDAVGRCIYCGTEVGKLGDEHILPYAIAGDAIILPKASCSPCAVVNNRVEGPMHRRQLKEVRAILGSPTRRPLDRPATVTLGRSRFKSFEPGETAEYLGDVEVAVEEAPALYSTLLLGLPGILLGLPLGTALPWDIFWTTKRNEKADPAIGDANAIRLGSFSPYLTAQYLSRIAYAYAVAESGLGSFMPLVHSLITGQTGFFRHWIGGEATVPPKDPATLHTLSHSWRTVKGIPYLVVTIRLFSFLGTPVQYVVVGHSPGPLRHEG